VKREIKEDTGEKVTNGDTAAHGLVVCGAGIKEAAGTEFSPGQPNQSIEEPQEVGGLPGGMRRKRMSGTRGIFAGEAPPRRMTLRSQDSLVTGTSTL
jgi:hypothetical protein